MHGQTDMQTEKDAETSKSVIANILDEERVNNCMVRLTKQI